MKYSLTLIWLLIIGISMPAIAVPVSLSAPSGNPEWSTNGVIWTLSGDAIPGVSTSGSFTLTADATGWDLGGTAYLSAFGLKNYGSSAEMSNLIAPSGTWDWVNQGLNGKGCKNNGPTADALCAFNTGGATSGPSTGSIFSFTFDITLDDVFPDFVHLKVHWVDEDGKKVGDLISQNFALVPEPGILFLLAGGLIGISTVSTLRKRAQR